MVVYDCRGFPKDWYRQNALRDALLCAGAPKRRRHSDSDGNSGILAMGMDIIWNDIDVVCHLLRMCRVPDAMAVSATCHALHVAKKIQQPAQRPPVVCLYPPEDEQDDAKVAETAYALLCDDSEPGAVHNQWAPTKHISILDKNTVDGIDKNTDDGIEFKPQLDEFPNLYIIARHAGVKNSKLQVMHLHNLPDLHIIDEEAFSGLSALKKLSIQRLPRLRRIGEHAFMCSDITELTLSELPLLGEFGDSVFARASCSVDLRHLGVERAVKVPSALTYIGSKAFTNAKCVILGNLPRLSHICFEAFYSVGQVRLYELPALAFVEQNAWTGDAIAPDLDLSSVAPSLTCIGGSIFTNRCPTIGAMKKLRYIGPCAFENCSFAWSEEYELDLHDTLVEHVGKSAFEGSNCRKLVLPSSIIHIGSLAFANTRLADLSLCNLNFLREIPPLAFSRIRHLRSVTLDELPSLQKIAEFAFCQSPVKELKISGLGALKSIDKFSFGSARITALDLSGMPALTHIGESAFMYSKITSLDFLPCKHLSTIGEHAFFNVNGSVWIGSHVVVDNKTFASLDPKNLHVTPCVAEDA